MRKSALIFLIIMFSVQIKPQYWQWQNGDNSVSSSYFKGFCKAGPDNYVLYYSNGILKKSYTNGASWFSGGTTVSESINKCFFINSALGWYINGSGSTYKTTDGGTTWSFLSNSYYSSAPVFLLFTDSLHGFTAWSSVLYRTSDGGKTWGSCDLPTSVNSLLSISFCDPLNGIVAGNLSGPSYNFVASTTDGGNTWDVDTIKTSSNSFKVICTDRNNWYGLSGIYFLRTANAGRMWSQIYLPGSSSGYDLTFLNSKTGWVITYGNKCLKTMDGGLNWQSFTVPAAINSYSGIAFYNENEGFIVGQSGLTAHTTNGGSEWITYPSGSVTTSDIVDISFLDANNGYAATQYALLSTTNSGDQWTIMTPSFPVTPSAIKFFSRKTGYVLSSYSLYKTTDSGATWFGRTINSSNPVTAMYFTDDSTAYAVGGSGYVYKTTNGGESWTQKTAGTSSSLYTVCFPDSETGYIAGYSGAVCKTTDKGSTWVNKSISTSGIIYKIYFLAKDTGFACTSNGEIYRTTNGGTSWISYSTGNSTLLRAIGFTTKKEGWIAGSNGVVYRTTDGGLSWSRVNITTTQAINTICINNRAIWFGGYSGAIISNYMPFMPATNNKIFIAGQPRKIQWYKRGEGTYKIDYSTDNGASWVNISSGVPDSQQYVIWPVPNLPLSNCKLRFSDQSGVFYSTYGTFSISTLGVTILQPADSIKAGSSVTVQWNGSVNSPMDVFFSADSGNGWIRMVSGVPFSKGGCQMPVPQTVTKYGRIKIAPSSDLDGSVISPVVFPVYVFHLTDFYSGVSLRAGSVLTINWSSSYSTPVNLDYSTNAGVSWQRIVSNFKDTNCYVWRIPRSVSKDCKLRITDYKNTADVSDSTFSILYSPIPIYIQIHPNPVQPAYAELLVSANAASLDKLIVIINSRDTVSFKKNVNNWYSGSVKFDSSGVYSIYSSILSTSNYFQDTTKVTTVTLISSKPLTIAKSADSKASIYFNSAGSVSTGMIFAEKVNSSKGPVYDFSSTVQMTEKSKLEIAYDPAVVSKPENSSLARIDDEGNVTLVPTVVDANRNCLAGTISEFGKYFIVNSDNPVSSLLPDRYQLNQNFPNPFNPSTRLTFTTPEASNVSIVVYDMLGRQVKTLITGNIEAGYHEVEWDGLNNNGRQAACGVYLCVMRAPNYKSTIKMLLVK